MRKINEVLRLHFEQQLGQRQIGRAINSGQSTVHDYLARFAAAGLSWPLPQPMTDAELEARLYPDNKPPAGEQAHRRSRALPDFPHIQHELKRGKHTTIDLLWRSTATRIRNPAATTLTAASATCSTSGGRARIR